MTHTLIIAELGSSWRFGNDERPFENAKRMIREAASCGADIVKMQWTSDAKGMAERRGLNGDAANMYAKYLQWPKEWMQLFKEEAEVHKVEWACTVYIPQDIPVIAPLVKRFKVSAYEYDWYEFVTAHSKFKKPIIVSQNGQAYRTDYSAEYVSLLYCVSKYPTQLEDLRLNNMWERYSGAAWWQKADGLSDHTTSTLTGALAVAAGATILEKHVRLWDTPQDNPDYGHSLILDSDGEEMSFAAYVRNVREAERCM